MVSPAPSRPPFSNRLLKALAPATRQRLLPHLQPVALIRGEQLGRPDDVVLHIDFVERGFVSLVKTMKDGRSVEVGGVGVEGATDPFSLFGIEAAVLESVVQVPGEALRIRCDILKAEVERDPDAKRLFADYARYFLGQIAQTAACNRLHSIEERACRWLLIAADNARSTEFVLTHEFLAMVLGGQRAGVSLALRSLRRAAVIDYRRGVIHVLDRAGLEKKACQCYETGREEADALFARRSAKKFNKA